MSIKATKNFVTAKYMKISPEYQKLLDEFETRKLKIVAKHGVKK